MPPISFSITRSNITFKPQPTAVLESNLGWNPCLTSFKSAANSVEIRNRLGRQSSCEFVAWTWNRSQPGQGAIHGSLQHALRPSLQMTRSRFNPPADSNLEKSVPQSPVYYLTPERLNDSASRDNRTVAGSFRTAPGSCRNRINALARS